MAKRALAEEQPAPDAPLPAAWQAWVASLRALLADAVLPLFLLHCKRGQPRVPVSSVSAFLHAAGGTPLPGGAAPGALRLLAEVCPEVVVVHPASTAEPSGVAIRLGPAAASSMTIPEDSGRRAASCGGVVARGFSLALPAEAPAGDTAPGSVQDAQGKRWRQAQGRFYTNVALVERELVDLKAKAFAQLAAHAARRRGEEPPPLVVEDPEEPSQPSYGTSGGDAGAAGASAGAAGAPAPLGDPAAAGAAPVAAPVLRFLAHLQGHEAYAGQVCHVESYPAVPAEYVGFGELTDRAGGALLSRPVVDALQGQMGIERLFQHQGAALRAVLRDRHHLCLTTGTSSGKSLAFAVPIMEAFLEDPGMRALVVFPTKALAQDQLGKLQRLFQAACPSLSVCTFDGDTPKAERGDLLRRCQVFLTNPDMLHFTILASHARWRGILESLRYVVLDEVHVYRASFGSHVAMLLRRFRRVLEHYGVAPQFIACSATMCNTSAFFMQLLALDDPTSVCFVDKDTAGRGDRQFCLWNPPVADVEEEGSSGSRAELNARKRARFREREGNGSAPRLPPGVGFKTRVSAFDEAAWIVAQAMRQGLRTVCFLQVRSMVEIVLQAAHGQLEDRKDLQRRLEAYRGGYAAADRRRLEQRLFSGDMLGVVATNALELGIDIGDLDVTVHVGLPPTVASVWQQAGRAGRRGRASCSVLVALDAPLEQHFCRHPRDFFDRPLEARLPEVDNAFLLHGHVLCAAVELPPLAEAEIARWFGPGARGVLEECRREGRLVLQPQASGSSAPAVFRHCPGRSRKAPKEEVSLRDIDPIQFKVMVRGSSTAMETLDQKATFMRLHPGAVYLHQKLAYFVEDLDLTARVAWVTPRDPKRIDYFTEAKEHAQVVLAGGGLARNAALARFRGQPAIPAVRCGRITCHWRMYGFRKRSKRDHQILDSVDLTLPAIEYPTQAVWMDLPGSVLQPVAQAGHSVDRGGLHALEHAMIALAPLCCELEAAELTCQHVRRDTDPNRFLLLLFESQKGGAGTVGKVYAQWESLLEKAVRLIEDCPCESGCPNCIVVPHCGEYNHGLDKLAALKIGSLLGLTARELPTAAAAAPGAPPAAGAPAAEAAAAAAHEAPPAAGAPAAEAPGEAAAAAVCEAPPAAGAPAAGAPTAEAPGEGLLAPRPAPAESAPTLRPGATRRGSGGSGAAATPQVVRRAGAFARCLGGKQAAAAAAEGRAAARACLDLDSD